MNDRDKLEEINSNTKVSDAIAFMQEHRNPCIEAVDWMKQYKDLSFIEGLEYFLEDAKAHQGWGVWALRLFGKQIGLRVREKLITKIHDSMMAFMLYIKAAWLTDEEDKLLEAKFKGKLPRAEKELAQGIVKRKKWR